MKLFWFALLLSTTNIAIYQEAIKLPIPSFADGTAINGQGVAFMMMLRRDIRRIQLGTTENGKTKGVLSYKGELHIIKGLIEIETTRGQDAELKACLHKAHEELIAKLAPWLNYGKGIKKVLTLLITEFCKKSNKQNSYLQQWGNIPEGEEDKFFNTEMNTFAKFDVLLTDMIGFFEALISSCPKAVEQFTHDMRMKALRKSAESIIQEEVTSDEYLTHIHIQETIVEQLIHHVERDMAKNGASSQTVQPDKKELKKFLENIIKEDKEKMAILTKLVIPMITKKITDELEQQKIVWEVRKALDASNEPIEKAVIKRIVARLVKEDSAVHAAAHKSS